MQKKKQFFFNVFTNTVSLKNFNQCVLFKIKVRDQQRGYKPFGKPSIASKPVRKVLILLNKFHPAAD